MKKIIVGALLALFSFPMTITGQTYSNLWKQVDEAENQDLPQTGQQVLAKIVSKAEKEKAYGQLLKALLKEMQIAMAVSPDSLEPAVVRLKEREQQAQGYPLQAVYQTVLSRIYADNRSLDENAHAISQSYAKQALAHPKELAAERAADYEPLVKKGADSRLFGDDLLSVIGMETRQWEALHQYYLTTPNRPAQLLTALQTVKGDMEKIDSLIRLYSDLQECGEAAIERFYAMGNRETTTAAEKVAYIDDALARWGAWKRMNELRNARNDLTACEFHVMMEQRVGIPNREQKLMLTHLRGIKELTLHVYHVKAEGNTQLNPNNETDYRTLKPLLTLMTDRSLKREYKGRLEHEVFEDSVALGSLPAGVYMIEAESQPKTEVSRQLYFVSDVRVLVQSLPQNTMRCVVVNATTGQPVKGAKLHLKVKSHRNANAPVTTVTCNNKGEYLYTVEKNSYYEVFATTDNDPYCPVVNSSDSYRFNEVNKTFVYGNVFTDRAIYRPGQTVHACAIIYEMKNGFEHQAVANKEVEAVLRDANYKVVAEKTLRTDDFGTAACDFALPSKGLTGQFTVSIGGNRCYFRVEEYKRPTFQVELPKPAQDYKAGDTLTVKGTAKSYAGVPVQGARVSYRVERRQAWWWRFWYMGLTASQEEIFTGETLTDAEGAFEVKMPMTMPEGLKHAMFYNFVVTTDVTDAAGETHSGELSLPLGNRKTALSVDIPEKILVEEQPGVTFHLRNAAGTDLDEEVSYRIDGGKWQKTRTCSPLSAICSSLKSGKHQLEAVCKDDTLTQSFVVFSLDDKRPAVDTDDWFYISANQFPNDGKPVTLQVGSSDKNVYMVYSVVAGNKILESGAVEKSNELLNRKFTYKEEYGKGLALCFAWYKDGKAHQHSVTIKRPVPDKKLTLKWETFRNRLTPGQQEEWTIKIEPSRANIQLLATLYDKSLDQIKAHDWSFTPRTSMYVRSLQWSYGHWGSLSLDGYWQKPYLDVNELVYSTFDRDCFPTMWSRRSRVRGSIPLKEVTVAAKTYDAVEVYNHVDSDLALQGRIGGLNLKGDAATADMEEAQGESKASEEQISVRENLQETAFFYPQLMADSTGIVAIKFTLPESLTTWRFMGLAHTQDMMYGMLADEAVAKKDVMIQPNVPRFLRMGDEATVSARIFNTTDKPVSGTVQIVLSDPESENVIHTAREACSLDANGSHTVSFSIPQNILQGQSLLICKMTVSGEGYSDGEQHYLPVLPNRERVTVTVPFTQTQPGIKTIDLSTIVPVASPATGPSASPTGKLTVEYTNNPAWLMIQALPTVAHPYDNCAICQATAFYANSLGRHILKQNPQAKRVFEMWKQESLNSQSSTLDSQSSTLNSQSSTLNSQSSTLNSQSSTLNSQLEKNEELKDLLLSETPWVLDADREAEQKQRLSDFFDENLMESRLSSSVEQLKKLQNSDGSWSWWPGMKGSFYMTAEISEMLVRLNQMTDNTQSSALKAQLDKAFSFMDNKILELVAEMKKEERKGIKQSFPSSMALQYLYMSTLNGRKLSSNVDEAQAYLKNLLKKEIKHQTLYEKALSAIILNAPLYVKSLKEYTVYKEDMGRYYDSPRAAYSWRDYRIPTQVAVIEAIQRLTPKDTTTIEEMRRWLLQEKRTQAWDTPINSAEAVYAFLHGNSQVLKAQEKTVLKIDGKPLETSEATAGMGYVKTAMPITDQKTFTAEKTSTGTSWGAVYAQFMQDTKDIADQSSEVSVKRELLSADRSSLSSPLKVGQRIRVRLTIEAKRDLDFVEVIDRRAACMEPVSQLSGYRNGYYCSPKDNATHYFFDMLSKGKHVIETEYYIDRAGQYETGTCAVQCAYAPEFRGTTHSVTLKIEN